VLGQVAAHELIADQALEDTATNLLPLCLVGIGQFRLRGQFGLVLLFEEPNRDFLAVDLGGEVRADEVVVDPEAVNFSRIS
jgi:hypothetical protein